MATLVSTFRWKCASTSARLSSAVTMSDLQCLAALNSTTLQKMSEAEAARFNALKNKLEIAKVVRRQQQREKAQQQNYSKEYASHRSEKRRRVARSRRRAKRRPQQPLLPPLPQPPLRPPPLISWESAPRSRLPLTTVGIRARMVRHREL